MKMTWKKKSGNKRLALVSQLPNNLPFDPQLDDNNNNDSNSNEPNFLSSHSDSSGPHNTHHRHPPIPSDSDSTLAHTFLLQGNQLAEDGKYREALGKWETAITLMPEKAALHEQKAQVLLEIGDAWGALKAATRATELDPSWAEAWTTLGRAQLNFGEPDSAIGSFDKALALKPELGEAQEDRRTALRLVKKREQLHTSGSDIDRSRFVVGDGAKTDS